MLVPVAAVMGRIVRLQRAVELTSMVARWLPCGDLADDRHTAEIVSDTATRLGARCLTKALVLHAVLECTGRDSHLVVGASLQDGQLRSHAWVERDGESLLGSTAGWATVWRIGR